MPLGASGSRNKRGDRTSRGQITEPQLEGRGDSELQARLPRAPGARPDSDAAPIAAVNKAQACDASATRPGPPGPHCGSGAGPAQAPEQ